MDGRRDLIRFARQNRTDPGKAEAMLWAELRHRALGPRFRRQDPLGPYIADFSCRSERIIIEVDDVSHTDAEADRRRDEWFLTRGWFVLRINDLEVLEALDETIELIMRTIADRDSIKDPLNQES